MDSMTPQLWRFLGEPVVLTEMIGRVSFLGEWGQSGLGIKHAEWAAPKAGDQMCSKCGCTGFATFEEAWTHKVKCMPEEREVQDWVQRKQAAEAVTDAIGNEREVEMEDSTVGRSSDDESTAGVSQAKKTEVQKSRAEQEQEFVEMQKQDLEHESEEQETHVWVECQCPGQAVRVKGPGAVPLEIWEPREEGDLSLVKSPSA